MGEPGSCPFGKVRAENGDSGFRCGSDRTRRPMGDIMFFPAPGLGSGLQEECTFVNRIYEIKIITDFSAAHNLRDFHGKCENLHGHNWKVEVALRGKRLDATGLLLDFGEVKRVTRELLQEVDHKYLNDLPFFKEQNPSSENIARYLFERLAERFNNDDLRVFSVSAWESSNACATFMID